MINRNAWGGGRLLLVLSWQVCQALQHKKWRIEYRVGNEMYVWNSFSKVLCSMNWGSFFCNSSCFESIIQLSISLELGFCHILVLYTFETTSYISRIESWALLPYLFWLFTCGNFKKIFAEGRACTCVRKTSFSHFNSVLLF